MGKPAVNIFWFRRDLRLHDNAALYYALREGNAVVPIFIFDTNILDELEEKTDRRVEFIHEALSEIQEELVKMQSSLEVYHGTPVESFKKLIENYSIQKVFANHDYEPYPQKRDFAVHELLDENGISVHTFKDQVILEKNEVIKDDGKPYTVFTPYSKRWKSVLNDFYLRSYPTEKYFSSFYRQPRQFIPSLEQIGFQKTENPFPVRMVDEVIIQNYQYCRDFPGLRGTSRLSVHLRFGTISVRALAKKALALSDTYLNELLWRDFYQMIFWHFPELGEGRAFRAEYDFIRWRNNEGEFERWCEGKTGYPIVDSGMRELNDTGFMHNRVRMIVASFLSKHLLIDWRWGEAYFAKKLLDFDFASNNGGWQWAAGCGCDAAPYFRIFNPYLQTKKFDPNYHYIRQWVPEFQESTYPTPIVDHEFARKRCLEVYGKALKEKNTLV